jgi:uncharacterized OB-fold protein
MSALPPPQPRPDPDSAGYWRHAAEGCLSLQRCASCERWQFPPLESCRHCNGTLSWQPVSGRGKVHSFVVQHHNVAPGFDEMLPYVIALVTPEEAPHVRLPARLIDVDPADVQIDAPVEAVVIPLPGGDVRVPVFRLSRR